MSVLSSILFNIHVGDLSEAIPECEVVQYSDDTQLLYSDSTDALQDFTERVEATCFFFMEGLFERNGLISNSNESQCVFIGTKLINTRTRNLSS